MVNVHASRPNNLPIPLTSFVGRTQEIAEVTRLLARTRLLTMTGAGGCGKTRLALRVAGELLPDYAEGVWMADLAALSDPTLVSHTVASALGVPEQPGRPLTDTLVDALRPKSVLLLLDNCEHLLAVCGQLADALLRRCPNLRILATSRERLGIAGELAYRVPSLSVPDPERLPSLETLTQYEAVCLFIDRATFSHPEFRVTSGNLPAVVQACQRLEGIPLAIEMAAAWVRVLTVEEILSRLSDRLQLLTSGSRGGLPRHQTLKTAMDWSYDLLSDQERVLLSRLSVFSGSWTLEAAEGVCAGDGIASSEILDLLTGLVDKSLVLVETHDGRARYRLLETVRQYGRDRLMEAGETIDMRRRHRDWYLALAERGEPELRGSAQVAWLERLETEHDNLRAALEWSKAEEGGAETWLRLAAALHQFWFMRGYFSEGREWLDGALSTNQSATASVRALALCGAGILAWRQGDSKGGILLQESLALFRELGNTWGIAYALHHVAHVLGGQGDYRQAAHTFEESVALFKKAGNTWGVGWSLYCLGDVMLKQGDDDRATAVLDESLALCRETGNTWTTAHVLGSLGLAAEKQGDYDRATALLAEGVAIAHQLGAKYHFAWLQCALANVSLSRGDSERALTLYRESLLQRREIGDRPGLADCLDGVADVASAQGDYEKAARLLGAAKALRGTSSYKRSPRNAAEHDRHEVSTRDGLGESAFAAAHAAGRAMRLEQAIECALTSIESLQPKRKEPIKSAVGKRAGLLAPREREVAVLIAEGKTNREIAVSLSITESTAEAHVRHILNKLGFNSRTQIAAWAVAHGLASSSPSASASAIDSS